MNIEINLKDNEERFFDLKHCVNILSPYKDDLGHKKILYVYKEKMLSTDLKRLHTSKPCLKPGCYKVIKNLKSKIILEKVTFNYPFENRKKLLNTVLTDCKKFSYCHDHFKQNDSFFVSEVLENTGAIFNIYLLAESIEFCKNINYYHKDMQAPLFIFDEETQRNSIIMPLNSGKKELEIKKTLVVNSSHILLQDNKKLIEHELSVITEYSIDLNLLAFKSSGFKENNDYSIYFNNICKFAIENNCNIISFDCDGPIVKDFKTFQW